MNLKILMLLMIFLSIYATHSQTMLQEGNLKIASKEIKGKLVKYELGRFTLTIESKNDEARLNSLVKLINGKVLRTWNPTGSNELDVVVQIPLEKDPFNIVEDLKKHSFIKNAEPNYLSTCEVNDDLFDTQWSLNQQSGVDIDILNAWNITTGSSSIKIAVLDTGIPMTGSSLSHEDLNNTNHIELVSGADIYGGDNYPADTHKHGTAVAGVCCAETNNIDGIAGVGYNCKLMPIRIEWRDASPFWVKQGVYKAVDNGAKVINLSHSFINGSQYLRDAIIYASNHGRLFVVAAGNQNTDERYPGSYSTEYDNLIAVSGTDNNDNRYSSSNYGQWINVAAPAVGIITTDLPGSDGYASGDYINNGIDGTSFAAPHVAGVAGLIYSIDNTLSPSFVRSIIQYSSKDLGASGFDNHFGWGRINAFGAVKSAARQFTLSGTLTTNEVWHGNITLTNNVFVPT